MYLMTFYYCRIRLIFLLEQVVNSAIKLCKDDVEGEEKDFMQDTKSEIGALMKR